MVNDAGMLTSWNDSDPHESQAWRRAIRGMPGEGAMLMGLTKAWNNIKALRKE